MSNSSIAQQAYCAIVAVVAIVAIVVGRSMAHCLAYCQPPHDDKANNTRTMFGTAHVTALSWRRTDARGGNQGGGARLPGSHGAASSDEGDVETRMREAGREGVEDMARRGTTQRHVGAVGRSSQAKKRGRIRRRHVARVISLAVALPPSCDLGLLLITVHTSLFQASIYLWACL